MLHARRTARCSSLPPSRRLPPAYQAASVPSLFPTPLKPLPRPPALSAHLRTAACLRRLPSPHITSLRVNLSIAHIIPAFSLDPHHDLGYISAIFPSLGGIGLSLSLCPSVPLFRCSAVPLRTIAVGCLGHPKGECPALLSSSPRPVVAPTGPAPTNAIEGWWTH